MDYSKEHSARRKKGTDTKKANPRTCKICKTRFVPERSELVALCSYDCQVAYANKVVLKNREIAKKADRKRIAEETEANKSTGALKKDLQDVINWIVKRLDKNYPCIARPGEATLRFDAGHYHGVGPHPALRYHLDNIHKQGSNSNEFKYGDHSMYRIGLVKRYGEDYASKVDSLVLEYPTLQPNELELREWKKKANAIRLRIKKGETMTRNSIHNELNIYK